MTDNKTHLVLQSSPVASCIIQDSSWVPDVNAMDCSAHQEASPDTYDNDATVTIATE